MRAPTTRALAAGGVDRIHGLLQGTGLTIGDAWIVGGAVWMMRRRDG